MSSATKRQNCETCLFWAPSHSNKGFCDFFTKLPDKAKLPNWVWGTVSETISWQGRDCMAWKAKTHVLNHPQTRGEKDDG